MNYQSSLDKQKKKKKSGGVRRGSFVNIQKQSVVGVFLKAGYLAWFHESNSILNRLAITQFQQYEPTLHCNLS